MQDDKYYYHYDAEGNLIFKEFITSGQPNVFDRKQLEKNLQIKTQGSGIGWLYEWSGNGMLKSVTLPQGSIVGFAYDPLGRRIAKQYKGKVTRWLWDDNVPLHEWQYEGDYPPKLSIDETNNLKEENESTENVITWLFEEISFVPCGKIVGDEKYSIVSDYLGTPTHAYNADGSLIWERELDIYGKARKLQGDEAFCDFLWQGQYLDRESGLAFNQNRHYDLESGIYTQQDPIGVEGGFRQYGYVHDSNSWIDPYGLSGWLLGQNLNKAGQGVTQGIRSLDWQAHHVIPQAVWKNNKDFFKEIGFKGKHSAANGIFLPNSATKAQQFGGFSVFHNGSHSDYSDLVRDRILQ